MEERHNINSLDLFSMQESMVPFLELEVWLEDRGSPSQEQVRKSYHFLLNTSECANCRLHTNRLTI